MHKRGRLQCLTGRFAGDFCCSELPQLSIDQRQKFCGSVRVALLNILEKLREIAHPCANYGKRERVAALILQRAQGALREMGRGLSRFTGLLPGK